MNKLIGKLFLLSSVWLCMESVHASPIIPALNGTFSLVEQTGTCFGGVGHDASEPYNLEIVSTEYKLVPAYIFENGLRHILNYSMKVGIFDQDVFGGAGIFRRVGEYTLDMRTFTFAEYSLPKNPTGLEKPQSFTIFELDQEEVLTVSNPIAGWQCKFVRK